MLNRLSITLTFIDKVQEVKESFKDSNIPDDLKSLDSLGLQNYFYDLPYDCYYLFIIIKNIATNTQNISQRMYKPFNMLGKCFDC